jgi:hypothetical protein
MLKGGVNYIRSNRSVFVGLLCCTSRRLWRVACDSRRTQGDIGPSRQLRMRTQMIYDCRILANSPSIHLDAQLHSHLLNSTARKQIALAAETETRTKKNARKKVKLKVERKIMQGKCVWLLEGGIGAGVVSQVKRCASLKHGSSYDKFFSS